MESDNKGDSYGDSITEQSRAQLDTLSKRLDATYEPIGGRSPVAAASEVDALKADLTSVRSQLVEARTALVEMGKSWQVKMEQLVSFTKQSKENDTNLTAKVAQLEAALAKQDEEMSRREDTYSSKINEMELNQQKQLMDMIDDLSTIGAKSK